MTKYEERHARTKFLREQRESQKLMAEYEIRPYRLGGWAIFRRGTKIKVGRINSGAVGIAKALIAICHWYDFIKKPPRKLKRTMKWSGTRRSDGTYIPVAERRAKAMSLAASAGTETRADPPPVDVSSNPHITHQGALVSGG